MAVTRSQLFSIESSVAFLFFGSTSGGLLSETKKARMSDFFGGAAHSVCSLLAARADRFGNGR